MKHSVLKTIKRQYSEFGHIGKNIVYFYMICGVLATSLINLSAIFLTKLIMDGFTIYTASEMYIYIGILMMI
ncbi:MAG: hypothetical protein WCZ19_02650 [Acholeplasma sp.]